MATRIEGVATVVHLALADSSVEMRVGRKWLSKNDQKRRIVWVSEGGALVAPAMGGGRQPEYQPAEHEESQFRLVACKIRLAEIDAHIYAETPELAEQLLDNLVAAVCLTVPQVELPRYREVTEEENREGHSVGVTKFILRLLVRLVVPDEVKPLRAITGMDVVCGIDRDDGSFEHEDGTVDPPPP